jgi:hypothetical protein
MKARVTGRRRAHCRLLTVRAFCRPSGFAGIGTGTGADPMACCNAATGTNKSVCTREYNAVVASGDGACGAISSALKQAAVCP